MRAGHNEQGREEEARQAKHEQAGKAKNNSWHPSTSRARHCEHAGGAHGQRDKHRQGQCGEDHTGLLHTAGGLAGICSEHVSHGSRVGMEGIHRGEDV